MMTMKKSTLRRLSARRCRRLFVHDRTSERKSHGQQLRHRHPYSGV
jgi:hypothetical protein